jgi:hypothetical protein
MGSIVLLDLLGGVALLSGGVSFRFPGLYGRRRKCLAGLLGSSICITRSARPEMSRA